MSCALKMYTDTVRYQKLFITIIQNSAYPGIIKYIIII